MRNKFLQSHWFGNLWTTATFNDLPICICVIYYGLQNKNIDEYLWHGIHACNGQNITLTYSLSLVYLFSIMHPQWLFTGLYWWQSDIFLANLCWPCLLSLGSEDLKEWDWPQINAIDNLTSFSMYFIHRHTKEAMIQERLFELGRTCASKHILNINRVSSPQNFPRTE